MTQLLLGALSMVLLTVAACAAGYAIVKVLGAIYRLVRRG